ncbi:unnamed protein product, partial [Discosporangium mesarthrocarpum]
PQIEAGKNIPPLTADTTTGTDAVPPKARQAGPGPGSAGAGLSTGYAGMSAGARDNTRGNQHSGAGDTSRTDDLRGSSVRARARAKERERGADQGPGGRPIGTGKVRVRVGGEFSASSLSSLLSTSLLHH